MKKTFVLFFMVLFASAAMAQDNALGLRIGYGAEISFQTYLNSSSRVEADLGIDFSSNLNIAAAYQIVKPLNINDIKLNWYYGGGATLGIGSGLSLGVIGQLGVEYKFDAPISLSLDWRPTLYVVPAIAFAWEGIALGVRYRF